MSASSAAAAPTVAPGPSPLSTSTHADPLPAISIDRTESIAGSPNQSAVIRGHRRTNSGGGGSSPPPQAITVVAAATTLTDEERERRVAIAVDATLKAPKIFSHKLGEIDSLVEKLFEEHEKVSTPSQVTAVVRLYADELAKACCLATTAAAHTSSSSSGSAVVADDFHVRFVELVDEGRRIARTELVGVVEQANALQQALDLLSHDVVSRARSVAWAWLSRKAASRSGGGGSSRNGLLPSGRGLVSKDVSMASAPASTTPGVSVDGSASPVLEGSRLSAPNNSNASPLGLPGVMSISSASSSTFLKELASGSSAFAFADGDGSIRVPPGGGRPGGTPPPQGMGVNLDAMTWISERAIIDADFGIVVQHWGQHAEAAKQYCKSLARFMNGSLNVMHSPFIVVFEVCGVTFTASTIAPIHRSIRSLRSVPEVLYFVEAAVAEQLTPPSLEALTSDCLFATGTDCRVYCFNALGAVDQKRSAVALEAFDGPEFNNAAVASMQSRALPRAVNELTAQARGSFMDVSSTLHRHGLRVPNVADLHATLSEMEKVREETLGASDDRSLTASLVATIAESMARVLKVVARTHFAVRADDLIPLGEDKAAQHMAIFVHQIVRCLVIEHATRVTPEQQLATTIAKLAHKKLKCSLLGGAAGGGGGGKAQPFRQWDLQFVSEPHVARRVAHMTGLSYARKTICGISPVRVVRRVDVSIKAARIDVFRGKHADVLRRLNMQVKCLKLANSPLMGHVGTLVADLFHLAHGRQGVSKTPSEVLVMMSDACQSGDERVQAFRRHDVSRSIAWYALSLAKEALVKAQKAKLGSNPSSSEGGAATGGAANFENSLLSPMSAVSAASAATPASPSPKPPSIRLDSHVAELSLLSDGSLRGTPPSAVAQLRVSVAIESFKNYFQESVACLKTARPPAKQVILYQRVSLLEALSRVVKDPQLCISADITMDSIDEARRDGSVDVRRATFLWNKVFAAQVELQSSANPRVALEHAQKKFDFAVATFGPESIQTGAAHNDVAHAMMKLNDLLQAKRSFELAFQLLKERTPHMIATLLTANNLAVTYIRLAEGKMGGAEYLKKRTKLLQTRIPADAEVLLSQANTVLTYVMSSRTTHSQAALFADTVATAAWVEFLYGRYRKAITLFEKALSLTKGYLSDEHADRAGVIRNLKLCQKRLRDSASLWITCMARRFLARRHVKKLRGMKDISPLIQRAARGYLTRCAVFRMWSTKRFALATTATAATAIHFKNDKRSAFDESDEATSFDVTFNAAHLLQRVGRGATIRGALRAARHAGASKKVGSPTTAAAAAANSRIRRKGK